jgi:hypothetical protein
MLGRMITALILMVIVGGSAYFIGSNVSAQHDQPAACVQYGGTWSLFSGWTCYDRAHPHLSPAPKPTPIEVP